MKHYFYSDGTEKHGPFTEDELKRQPISPETLVWTQGMNDWKEAREFPELRPLFANTPPPLKHERQKKNQTPSWPKWTILTVAVALVLFLVVKQCSNSGNAGSTSEEIVAENTEQKAPGEKIPAAPAPTATDDKAAYELRDRLLQKEIADPIYYLSLEYSLRNNLFGKQVISGSISNSANVASFKDIVLQVTYKTKTGSVIGSEEIVLYEYLHPKRSVEFKEKRNAPDGTKLLNVKIKSAKGAQVEG